MAVFVQKKTICITLLHTDNMRVLGENQQLSVTQMEINYVTELFIKSSKIFPHQPWLFSSFLSVLQIQINIYQQQCQSQPGKYRALTQFSLFILLSGLLLPFMVNEKIPVSHKCLLLAQLLSLTLFSRLMTFISSSALSSMVFT